MSYFFHVGGLVEDLHDLLGELVVGLGPDASSLVCFNHCSLSAFYLVV